MFSFIVGGDSRVYEGRGWYEQPDQDFQFPELKGKRLDIGFIGDYTRKYKHTEGCGTLPKFNFNLKK